MSVSSQFPNTRKLMKARARRPSAFIVFKCWNRWNTKHSFLKLLLNRASLTKNNETKKNQKMFLLLISFSFSLNSDNTRMAYLVTGLLYVWGWRYLFFEVWNLFRTFKARVFLFLANKTLHHQMANYSCPNERSYTRVQLRWESCLPHGIFGRWFYLDIYASRLFSFNELLGIDVLD